MFCWGAFVLLLGVSLACSPSREQAAPGLSGTVRVDGSSTVFPITEAVAEEFQRVEPRARVTVGIAGTGGGFKRFLAGETDINDASRPIDASEQEHSVHQGLQYIELPIAYDGLSVVVNPTNDFVDFLTVEELKRIWEPASRVRTWSDVRPEWPTREIHLYGPGTDSGTFDYFTEAINGKAKAIRSDFNASEDDNVLVQGTSGDRDALAFFGYAYYRENQQKLKVVPVDAGQGPVPPSPETIRNGTY
ncbi:MAG: PstS family phosphate ABC transporter substrate-binding protein, partial [Acidobacteria bacterium]|nr:PstS family phosphate ABC transporter substrate-binding protein [Acidobacteriota bacterium]